MLAPEIIFEDQHLIILSKPAGLLSQGEKTGDENLVDWLRKHVGRPYVGLVHRLDRNTSGIMVVAKRTKSAQRLTDALKEGAIERTYLAWCHGRMDKPARWAHRLFKDENKNLVRVVSHSHPQGKDSILTASPAARGDWQGSPLTLIEFRLETGRSHQIRVQASHEGYPLLGDRKYGKGADGFPRPALHSHRLRFKHPMSDKIFEAEAALPEDFASIRQIPL